MIASVVLALLDGIIKGILLTSLTDYRGVYENNILWIGHRYATRFEAEAVASVFAERLKESAA